MGYNKNHDGKLALEQTYILRTAKQADVEDPDPRVINEILNNMTQEKPYARATY